MSRMAMAAALAAALLSCSPAPAFADEIYLYTGGWSKHLSGKDYNETHNVLGLQYGGWMAAYFVNSYGDEGGFAGYHFIRQRGHFEYSVMVGGVHAYRGCWSDGEDVRKARQRKIDQYNPGVILGLDEPTPVPRTEKTLCPLVTLSATYTRYRLQPQLGLWGNAVVLSLRWKLN